MTIYDNETGEVARNLAHVIDNPFDHRSVQYAWEEGQSVLDILNTIDADLANNAIVAVSGHQISKEHWHLVRPKVGTTLAVTVVPHDKETWRSIGFIGLAIVSAVTGNWVAAQYFGSSAFAAAVVGAGVYTVGAMAINALLPLETTTFEQENITRSQSLQVGAPRNRIMPYAPLPILLGRMRMYPNQAALPYTSYSGGEQSITMLLYLGMKEICVEKDSARLGETPLSSLSGVTIEYDTGCGEEKPITVYTDQVYEEQVNSKVSYCVTDITTKPPTECDDITSTAIIKRTQPNVDKAQVELRWLNGLILYKADGRILAQKTCFNIDYRKVGSSGWTKWNGCQTAKTRDAITFTKTLKFPSRGQYDIRIYGTFGVWLDGESLYGEKNSLGYNVPTWTVLRSITKDVPINQVPIGSGDSESPAVIGLELVASDNLTGTPDTFNIIGWAKAPDWTGSIWEDQGYGTSNPASILKYLVLLNNKANAKPLAEARIDDTSFQEFWTWCDDNEFEFNMYVDFQSTVLEMINMVAAAGRAICYPVDGLWLVKIDKKQTTSHQFLSPRNTIEFTASKGYPDEIHGFRVRFKSEVEDFNTSEMIVYKDGYDKDTGYLFEGLDLPGVTDPDQVWLLARYWLNVSIIQRETFKIVLDIENLVSLPGDRIEWQEECLLTGLGAARVVSFSNPTMVLDAEMEYAAESYGFTIRHSDGASATISATPVGASPTATWTLASSPSVVAGDLAIFGVAGEITQPLIIKDILPAEDMTATLTCLVYDHGLYPEENSDTPPVYVPVITAPPDVPVPELNSTVNVSNDGSSASVSWDAYVADEGVEPDLGVVDYVLVSYREALLDESGVPSGEESSTPWVTEATQPNTGSLDISTDDGVWYDVKVQYVYDDGTISSASESTFQAKAPNAIYPITAVLTLETGKAWVGPMTAKTATLTLETYPADITFV